VNDDKKKDEKKDEVKQEPFNWLRFIKYSAISVFTFLLLLIMSPFIIWSYFNVNAKKEKELVAFKRNRAVYFYLNQVNEIASSKTPLEFATSIDNKYKTNLIAFSLAYQKLKYNISSLTNEDKAILTSFYSDFINQLKRTIPFKTRLKYFLNLYNTIRFFTTPKIN
jgi:hypothetical protein